MSRISYDALTASSCKMPAIGVNSLQDARETNA